MITISLAVRFCTDLVFPVALAETLNFASTFGWDPLGLGFPFPLLGLRSRHGVIHRLPHLREGHHRVVFLRKIDFGDGLFVQVDDGRGVFTQGRHAIPLDQHGGHDGLAGLAGEWATEPQDVHQRSAGHLGALLITEVGAQSGAGCH